MEDFTHTFQQQTGFEHNTNVYTIPIINNPDITIPIVVPSEHVKCYVSNLISLLILYHYIASHMSLQCIF